MKVFSHFCSLGSRSPIWIFFSPLMNEIQSTAYTFIMWISDKSLRREWEEFNLFKNFSNNKKVIKEESFHAISQQYFCFGREEIQSCKKPSEVLLLRHLTFDNLARKRICHHTVWIGKKIKELILCFVYIVTLRKMRAFHMPIFIFLISLWWWTCEKLLVIDIMYKGQGVVWHKRVSGCFWYGCSLYNGNSFYHRGSLFTQGPYSAQDLASM